MAINLACRSVVYFRREHIQSLQRITEKEDSTLSPNMSEIQAGAHPIGGGKTARQYEWIKGTRRGNTWPGHPIGKWTTVIPIGGLDCCWASSRLRGRLTHHGSSWKVKSKRKHLFGNRTDLRPRINLIDPSWQSKCCWRTSRCRQSDRYSAYFRCSKIVPLRGELLHLIAQLDREWTLCFPNPPHLGNRHSPSYP